MTIHTPPDPAAELTEVVLPGVVQPDGLIVHQRMIPVPEKGQVLVQMLATGVSFAEQAMRRGRYPGQPKFPFVPGYDLVGVVTATGPHVDPALVGRRVAAVTKTGGWSTHPLLDARDVIPIPDELDAAEGRDHPGQRHHRLADAAPQSSGQAWTDDPRPRRQRRRRHHPGAARASRWDSRHRHRLTPPPRHPPHPWRRTRRLPRSHNHGAPSARARP